MEISLCQVSLYLFLEISTISAFLVGLPVNPSIYMLLFSSCCDFGLYYCNLYVECRWSRTLKIIDLHGSLSFLILVISFSLQ